MELNIAELRDFILCAGELNCTDLPYTLKLTRVRITHVLHSGGKFTIHDSKIYW